MMSFPVDGYELHFARVESEAMVESRIVGGYFLGENRSFRWVPARW